MGQEYLENRDYYKRVQNNKDGLNNNLKNNISSTK